MPNRASIARSNCAGASGCQGTPALVPSAMRPARRVDCFWIVRNGHDGLFSPLSQVRGSDQSVPAVVARATGNPYSLRMGCNGKGKFRQRQAGGMHQGFAPGGSGMVKLQLPDVCHIKQWPGGSSGGTGLADDAFRIRSNLLHALVAHQFHRHWQHGNPLRRRTRSPEHRPNG